MCAVPNPPKLINEWHPLSSGYYDSSYFLKRFDPSQFASWTYEKEWKKTGGRVLGNFFINQFLKPKIWSKIHQQSTNPASLESHVSSDRVGFSLEENAKQYIS